MYYNFQNSKRFIQSKKRPFIELNCSNGFQLPKQILFNS